MGEAAKLFTRSLMMGLDSAVRKPEFAEPTAEDIENMPYHEAVEFLKKRDVIKKVDYDKLSDKMKFRAFTASRINDGKLLEKLNAQMLANVNGGKGLKDFLSLTKTDILDKIGMGPNQGWYWETVYRTNAQTAYNVGRAMGFEADKPLALQFVGIDDARQTDVCHSLSGIVRPYGDPFWQSHFPPLHFNCRSTIRAIYDEAELPEEWSGLDEVESPAKGFGSYPLDSDNWWKELDSQVRQAKQFGVQGEIEAAKVALGVDSESGETFTPASNKILSAEEQKKVDEIREKFIENDFFLPATNKYLSLDGMDEETAKSIYESFEKIFMRFPKMKGVLPAIKTVELPANVYARTVIINEQKQILFNRLFYKDYKTLFKAYAEDVKANIHPRGTTAKSNVFHEFAHCLENILYQRMTKKYKKNYKCFSEFAMKETLRLTNLSSTNIITNVSIYATKNSKEWFAECFAEGMESKSPREMASTLMTLIDIFL